MPSLPLSADNRRLLLCHCSKVLILIKITDMGKKTFLLAALTAAPAIPALAQQRGESGGSPILIIIIGAAFIIGILAIIWIVVAILWKKYKQMK